MSQNWQKPFTVEIYRNTNFSWCLLLRTQLGRLIAIQLWESFTTSVLTVWKSFIQRRLKVKSTECKKGKVAHTRLPNVGFRSWSRFLAVSLQVTWVINPAAGCHYVPPGLQLPSQPLRGLLPVSLLGEQRHDWCEQFAQDCYPTASRLRFEPGPFCAWVQHANHSATEPRPKECI